MTEEIICQFVFHWLPILPQRDEDNRDYSVPLLGYHPNGGSAVVVYNFQTKGWEIAGAVWTGGPESIDSGLSWPNDTPERWTYLPEHLRGKE